MNTTRCGVVGRVCALGLVLLILGTAEVGPGGPSTARAAEVPDRADPRFTGTWQATININGADIPFVWVVTGDTFATSIPGQPAPFARGKFEAADGKWKTTPEGVFPPPDQGPFHFVDADTVAMIGQAGKEVVWKRVKAPAGIVPPAAVVPPNQPARAPDAAGAAEPLNLAADLSDFPRLREQAKAAAARWDAAAKCFRVDAWGAYAGSRFQPAGARFLYFSPKGNAGGYEVRAENNVLQGSVYPLEAHAAPQALPEDALPPGEALRRLWDLAPSVRSDQVYLQLLRPGAEKAAGGGGGEGDWEAAAYPLRSFLDGFPVPMREVETDAPKGRAVWRMVAVRDFDVPCDQAYGTFISIDAATGEALSRRRPAVGVQIYRRHKLTPPTPIQPFVFPQGDVAPDSPAERVGTFDALAVAQKAESMDLGLRLLVRNGKPDAEVRRAVDQMCDWWKRVEQVRTEDAARGVAVLEEAARQEPDNIARQAALLWRYVNEVEREKKRALGSDLVVKIEGLNKRSEFWLSKQFEVSAECLGTRNQTHMVLDARTNEWIYKMADPPHTRVFSRYYRPAAALAKAVRAMGKRDFEFERQLTRLRWLAGGNGPAIGDEDSVSPVDPLQLMCLAEYNRVRGSETMAQAEQLRLPKSWSSTSRRELGNGTVEVATTTFTRPPTQDELAAADRLDAVARQQEAPRVAQVQDLAMKLDPPEPTIYYLWSRVEAAFYDAQLADRVAVRGLMIDPGCAELHAARLIAWQNNADVNKAEEYCVEKFSQPYTPADLVGGGALSKYDPWAAYFLTLQRLRIAPQNVGSHAILCDVLAKFEGLKINDQETMPDAAEQRQRELGVAAAMMARLLDHPDEWQEGVPKGMPATRENLVRNQVNLLTLRGEELTGLRRNGEARACFQKVLTLDPGNAAARKGME